MAKTVLNLTLEEEFLILLFWAYGKDLEAKLGTERIWAIPGLGKAIEAISPLPAAIGWGDKPLTVKSGGQRQNPEQRL